MRARLALALVSALGASWALAAPVGTLLFAQPGVQIIDQHGQSRPARQGDPIEAGERLVTPDNALSQLRLLDGSLIGVRPGSEIAVALPDAASGTAQQVISLLSGKLRVIGGELVGGKPTALLLNAGESHLQLNGADLEAAVVSQGKGPAEAGIDRGSYSRLLVGSARLSTGAVEQPLSPREVNFVATGALPVLAAISPNALFADPRTLPSRADRLSNLAPRVTTPPPSVGTAPPTRPDRGLVQVAPADRFAALSPVRSTLTGPSALPLASAPTLPTAPPVGIVPTTIAPIKTTTLGVMPPPPIATLPPIAIIQPPVIAPIYVAPLVRPIVQPQVILPTCRFILGQFICS